MSLKDRLSRRVKGLASALLAPAEDPRRTYADAFARQRELLAEVAAAMSRLAAAKERLAGTLAAVRRRAALLEEEAGRALLADGEGAARLALQRRQVALTELHVLEEQLAEVERERQRLALLEQRLTMQVETFRAREETLAARHSAVAARVRLGEALGGLGREMGDLDRSLRAAQRTTDRMQARATALDELVGVGLVSEAGRPLADALERDLATLDVEREVDARLATLKQEFAAGRAPPAAGPGDRPGQ